MERIAKTKFAFACAFICVILFFCMHACVSCVYKTPEQEEVEKLEAQIAQMREIHAAYAAVLHRAWIDMPPYVEDVLWETEEYLTLDSLLNGDFEDTFFFWSPQDSLDYEQSWEEMHDKTALILRKEIR